jgi:DNA polymerase I-like protein with 3'-5' exonuclease and polymerase domains
MIYLITNREKEYDFELESNGIKISNIIEFNRWFKQQDSIQLDTETNVVRGLFSYQEKNPNDKVPKWILDEAGNRIPIERELYVVQIGDKSGNDQWLFEITEMSNLVKIHLKKALSSNVQKIAHNALFEYTIIKKTFDIDISNIRDTYLMSRILHTGLKMPKGFHSLSGCLQRYFGFNLDKGAQTSFSNKTLSLDQILYAAQDVVPLGMLHDAMQIDIDKWDLENVVRLECAVLRPYGDAMVENFYLDIPKWRGLVSEMQIEYDKTLTNLYEILNLEFKEQCEILGFIQSKDEYYFNWKSTKMKNQILKIFYPNIPSDCTTLPKFKKYIKILEEETEEDTTVLEQYLNKNYSFIEQQMIINYQDKIKELNLFIPKGEMLINFNSPEQVLSLFQLIDPKLEKVNKKALIKLKHPLILTYKSLKKYAKLITSYGENFIDAVGPDGMLRINDLNQILDTGRTSLALYQILPNKGSWRNCFYPPEGYSVVGNDFSGQELCVAATISGDERMLLALKNGYDVHSISASIVFPDEWKALGEDPNPTGKPKTKEGNNFRDACKKILFGEVT